MLNFRILPKTNEKTLTYGHSSMDFGTGTMIFSVGYISMIGKSHS